MSTNYKAKLQQQVDQYRHVENMHDLPEIFHFWSNKYIRPKLNAVLGVDSVVDFFAESLRLASLAGGSASRFASLGCGDGHLEIKVAARLKEMGVEEFVIDCFEYSPVLVERAGAAIKANNLSDYLLVGEVDLNHWKPGNRVYDGVMANHSLHHLVELELIFDRIKTVLRSTGVFVTSDMIGRNGHLRWPEMEHFVEQIWAFMPDRLKFNRQLNCFDEKFVNRDCSTEGFEGIRAQEILPLLVERFHFSHLLAYGGLTDVFVDRGYGHNFDPKNDKDLALIEFIHGLNELLLEQGILKPTMMFAIMQPSGSSETKCDKNLSPSFAIRRSEVD